MGISSRDIKTMDDLFVHTLRDIYYAEKQIAKALPDMIEKSTDAQLKQGFQTHLGETEESCCPPGADIQAARPRSQRRGLPRDRRHNRRS